SEIDFRKTDSFSNIEELKLANLKIGDVVEVLGYYTAGDGAHHKRKIEATDDGSGVQLVGGLWANVVHNGEVNVSWFGAEPINADCSILLKTLNTDSVKTIDCNKFEFNVSESDKNTDFANRSFFFFYKQIKNVKIVGDVSFTNYIETNTFGSDKIVKNIEIQGNLKISSWRSVYNNIKVSENLYLEGGDTPSANWWGCGWNKFEKIYVDKGLITNVYYGWVNLNNFISCRFGFIHCFNKEITPPIANRVLDYHLNKFDSCEIYSDDDRCVVYNNTKFSVLIEEDCKGSNYFDNLYSETAVIAYKGKLNIKGLHTAGKQVVYSSDVILESASMVTANSTASTGKMSTDILYNCWNDTKIEENNVYIPKVYFVPYNSSLVSEDLTEPSGLGKKMTINIEGFRQFELIPNTTGNVSIFVKKTESDPLHWVCEDKNKFELYNIGNEVLYADGWSLLTFKNVFKVKAYNNSSVKRQLTISNSSCSVGDSVMTPVSDGSYKNSVAIIDLNTPYHATKMQQLGIYEDFIAYMDEQHEYEQLQREVETKRQEAYQLALIDNSELSYETWLSEQAEMLPIVEPVPSQALLDFKKKYLG
ncbi:MAG: hypothetical protein ACRCZ2_07415, partial [Fusobacteriaceae bacterium]